MQLFLLSSNFEDPDFMCVPGKKSVNPVKLGFTLPDKKSTLIFLGDAGQRYKVTVQRSIINESKVTFSAFSNSSVYQVVSIPFKVTDFSGKECDPASQTTLCYVYVLPEATFSGKFAGTEMEFIFEKKALDSSEKFTVKFVPALSNMMHFSATFILFIFISICTI